MNRMGQVGGMVVEKKEMEKRERRGLESGMVIGGGGYHGSHHFYKLGLERWRDEDGKEKRKRKEIKKLGKKSFKVFFFFYRG